MINRNIYIRFTLNTWNVNVEIVICIGRQNLSFNLFNRGDLYMILKNATKWMSALSLSLLLAACGNNAEDNGSESATGDFDSSQDFHVITREDGSGTRGAFAEIVDVIDDNGDDVITQTATVQNGTSAVMQGVAGDQYAIGYISLGSLDDSVKGIEIDGAAPTAEAITSGDYTVARNFNVVYGSELSEVAQDFYDFFFSAQAQDIAVEQGYVAVDSDAAEYEATGLKGTISVVGSTSVEPLMAAFAEAYQELNPDVKIDITAPGSGAGITAAIDGSANIGMASRELDDEETSQVEGVDAIAVDGIAVIVNKDNPISGLTLDQVQGIYLGDTTSWSEVE